MTHICRDNTNALGAVVGKLLVKSKKTVAVAESCSGGCVSNMITNTPGSSKYFKTGIVAYSNEIKTDLLGIDNALIKTKGAVSKDVAVNMAINVRSLAKTDFGFGITGIAGPSGGTKAKPVGTVFIALSMRKKTLIKKYNFTGTRQEIKLQTAQEALNMLQLELL